MVVERTLGEAGSLCEHRYHWSLPEGDGQRWSYHSKKQSGPHYNREGENWLQSITEHLARAEVHDEASIGLRVNEYTDLLDLIQARKTIEMETVRLAAVNATQDELWKLRQSVSLYYRDVAENKSHDDSAYNFHTIIAEMSRNKYFKYLLDIMILKSKNGRAHGQAGDKERGNVYVVQHDDIVAALELRDADLAQQRMGAHIDTMLSDVKHQIEQIQALAKRILSGKHNGTILSEIK